MIRNLVIRADTIEGLGSGHIFRMLALGQAWQDLGGKVIFITNATEKSILQALYVEDFTVHNIKFQYPNLDDLHTTLSILQSMDVCFVVLDGYHFDTEYQRSIKNAGYNVCAIEDMKYHDFYDVDILLVQGLQASQYGFSCADTTVKLFGAKYALLRREFIHFGTTECKGHEKLKVLVNFGGEDLPNTTLFVLNCLEQLQWTGEVVALIGPINAHKEEIEKFVKNSILHVVMLPPQANMPQLLSDVDMLIGAGGGTCWEAFFLGLPIFALAIAENQIPVLQGFKDAGVISYAGTFPCADREMVVEKLNTFLYKPNEREKIKIAGQNLVDGKGAYRLASKILEIINV